MKKYLIYLILVMSVVVGVGVGYGVVGLVAGEKPRFGLSTPQATVTPVTQQNGMSDATKVAVASPSPTSVGVIPVKLTIPDIGVNALVEKVGLDSKKNMDVPKGAMNVGWYSLGYKVGENGSAVMAGHYDKKDGSPAVFYNLSDLQIGDKLSVLGEDGKTLNFRVTGKQDYDANAFPIANVFGSAEKAKLNLITCSGEWNSSAKSYTTRTVVYSELVE